jgi:magnesium-transporting ATPase (P-type)
VVSIGRQVGQGSEERTVPADMLLLSGNVIANEALLTGESTPQWKVFFSLLNNEHDNKILFMSFTIMYLQRIRSIYFF